MTSGENRDSNTFEADGISMEIMMPDPTVIAIPKNGLGITAPVKLSISITNNAPTPVRFNPYENWIPELIGSDGRERSRFLDSCDLADQEQPNEPSLPVWRVMLARFISNLTRQYVPNNSEEISDGLLVNSRTTINIYLKAQLLGQENLLKFKISMNDFYFNRPTFYWYFNALEPGKYQLRFIYLSACKNRQILRTENTEARILEEIGLSQLATPFVNLRFVQPVAQDSNCIEVDGILFKTKVPEKVLRLPKRKRKAYTNVQIGMRIVNDTQNLFRFSFYDTLTPELLGANGQAQQTYSGRNAIQLPRESDFPLVMPGECITFFPEVRLLWLDRDRFRLLIIARDGSFSWFNDLRPGKYQIRFRYQKINELMDSTVSEWEPIVRRFTEIIWSGRVDTPFVEFNLVCF